MNLKNTSFISFLCLLMCSCSQGKHEPIKNTDAVVPETSTSQSRKIEVINDLKGMGEITFASVSMQRLIESPLVEIKEKQKTNRKGETTIDTKEKDLHKTIYMSSFASAEAGIRMSEFDPSKSTFEEDRINLVLPKVDTLKVESDAEKAGVLYERYDRIASSYITAEQRHLAQLKNLKEIRDNIYNTSIIQDAEENAREFFCILLQQYGYQEDNIIIDFEK